ncbi:hypothetical protein UACE39S_00966 [Ureibacillus acetophenoni]|uniref:hypothetical protein n=1 Tax=Ureibacillus sp. MALMAid1270 TaxID=3411629 RepID=UPI003BA62F76
MSKSREILATRRDCDNDMTNPKDMELYDQLHPDGVYVSPGQAPKIRVRDMDKYCKERGIEPKDLSEEEWKKFRY